MMNYLELIERNKDPKTNPLIIRIVEYIESTLTLAVIEDFYEEGVSWKEDNLEQYTLIKTLTYIAIELKMKSVLNIDSKHGRYVSEFIFKKFPTIFS